MHEYGARCKCRSRAFINSVEFQSLSWKAETLKVCLLLVWRVCDQAFGRYRPLNGAEKWSHDHHKNWKFAYTRRKIQWFQKCYSFWSMTKNNEVIAEKPFQNNGVARRLWLFQHNTVLERSTEVGFSYSFDLQSCLHKYKRPACHAGYAATRWRNLL